MKSENGRQIKSASLQVVEIRQPLNRAAQFLRHTREMIFHRWFVRGQEELYLAEQYGVRRVEIESAVRQETRLRLVPPPAPVAPRESAVACERPQGIIPVEPGELCANGKTMRLWQSTESGTQYLQVQGGDETRWFALKKAA